MEKPRNAILYWLKWGFVAALLIFALARLYYALTDDFRLSNIASPIPHQESWEISAPSAEEERHLKQILDQPYFYLGKGAQCYAFASEDGRYVLKFFKFKHLRPSLFIDALPAIGDLKAYKEKQTARKQRKLFGVFRSYKLAYDVDKSESGLIFIQLNKEGNPQRHVTIVDKIGLKYTLDLKDIPFLLQNKGSTLRVVIDSLLKKGDVETAKMRFGQILDLYSVEYSKGIYDHDHGIMQNTGFIGDEPIHLDVGKLEREEKMRDKSFAKQDALLVIGNIDQWVAKHYPQYGEQILNYLNQKIEQLY